MLTGFPFHPKGAFAPQGHLRQTGLYAAVFRPASRQALDCWPEDNQERYPVLKTEGPEYSFAP